MIRYTEEHEWLALDEDIVTVGITEHAVEQLGDIVFVDLPEEGDTVEEGGEAGVVESVKAASDVYAPASGTVVEINEAIRDNPALVNQDPLGDGWFFKLRLDDPSAFHSFMSEDEYGKLIGQS